MECGILNAVLQKDMSTSYSPEPVNTTSYGRGVITDLELKN